MSEVMLTQDHSGEGVFPTWQAGTPVERLAPCQTYARWWQGHIDGYDTYFPQDILDNGRLTRAYNPTELSLPAGSRVSLLAIVGGWAWCEHGRQRGWLPVEKLQSVVLPDFIP